MGTINSSMQAVQQAQADLIYADNPPPLGHDLVSLLSTYYTVFKNNILGLMQQIQYSSTSHHLQQLLE